VPLKTKDNPKGLLTELEAFDMLTTLVRISLVSVHDFRDVDSSLLSSGMVNQLTFKGRAP